jgi:1-acyl-sn-glycerol-3-phosphate acyltransferase
MKRMRQDRSQAGYRSGWYRTADAILTPMIASMTIRSWSGQQHIPAEGGAVIAANHVSHIDPLTLAHFLNETGRAVRYLAKDSLFEAPVVGQVLAGAGQIPVHRGASDAGDALRSAVAAVRAGEVLVVYPEGSLTRDPDEWPMRGKTGAARVALATGAPVIPVAQWGPQNLLPPYSKRLRLVGRTPVQVTAGPAVDLDDLHGQAGDPEAVHEATDRIMAAITELLAGIRGAPAPEQRFDPRAAGMSEYGDPRKRQKRRKAR